MHFITVAIVEISLISSLAEGALLSYFTRRFLTLEPICSNRIIAPVLASICSVPQNLQKEIEIQCVCANDSTFGGDTTNCTLEIPCNQLHLDCTPPSNRSFISQCCSDSSTNQPKKMHIPEVDCNSSTSDEAPSTDGKPIRLTQTVESFSKPVVTSPATYHQITGVTPANVSSIADSSSSVNKRGDDKKGADLGLIIGVVVGGTLLVVLVLIAAVLLIRRRPRNRKLTETQTTNPSANGYQHMTSGDLRPPAASYDNLTNTSSAEQGPGANHQTEPKVYYNNKTNRKTLAVTDSFIASKGSDNYDNTIKFADYSEVAPSSEPIATDSSAIKSIAGSSSSPSESNETTLVENKLYGSNSSVAVVPSYAQNKGETTVVENDMYKHRN